MRTHVSGSGSCDSTSRKHLGIVFGGYYNSGGGVKKLDWAGDRKVRGPWEIDKLLRVKEHADGVYHHFLDGYQSDLFVFDPDTLLWTRVSSKEHEMIKMAKCWAGALNNRLFVGGGYGMLKNQGRESSKEERRVRDWEEEWLACLSAASDPEGDQVYIGHPQHIVDPSKVILSLHGAGQPDESRHLHICTSLVRNQWACCPPETDIPDFDVGFGGHHERTFVIYVFAGCGDHGQALLYYDSYQGPLSTRGLEVLEKRKLVDWSYPTGYSCGPPHFSHSKDGKKSVGCMTYGDLGAHFTQRQAAIVATAARLSSDRASGCKTNGWTWKGNIEARSGGGASFHSLTQC
jgi:hypothetical protein